MTEAEIKEIFQKVVLDNDLMSSIDATKYQLVRWRHPEKQKTGIRTMLEVLWKLDLIQLKP